MPIPSDAGAPALAEAEAVAAPADDPERVRRQDEPNIRQAERPRRLSFLTALLRALAVWST
jgi:hypothetical protein